MENKTILIIEDNEMNMVLFKVLLQLEGFNVLEAMDAEKGIQLAHEHSPDFNGHSATKHGWFERYPYHQKRFCIKGNTGSGINFLCDERR